MDNPFKRNPQEGAIGILEARANALAGGHSGFYKVGTRHPAWVSLTGRDKSCNGSGRYNLPVTRETLNEEYNSFKEFKPNPIISEVVVEYGGDYGLATTVSVRILCYTKGDFEQIQKHFLQPGNRVDVSFGYGPNWSAEFPVQQSAKLVDMVVAAYAFSTTSEGGWEANFKAVSMCTGLQDIDLGAGVLNETEQLVYQAGGKRYPVNGILELLTSDAQLNGKVAIDDIKKPGKIITTFKDYTPSEGFGAGKNVAIVVYTPEHLQVGANTSVKGDPSVGSGDTGPNTYNVVYVTLGYLIDRVFNDQIHKQIKLRICEQDKTDFEKTKIYADPDLSFAYVPPDPEVQSGSPTSVLILGGAKGDYKTVSGKGKNFEQGIGDITPAQAWTGESENGRGQIDLTKILISRNVIKNALEAATMDQSATADTTDVKSGEDQVISFNVFFKEIFGAVKFATGGTVDMRLTEEWRPQFGIGSRYVLLDQNNGYMKDKLQCIIFNPVDGDGSTRNCSVTTGAGGREMKAQMFSGSSRKSVTAAHSRGCEGQLADARELALARAVIKVNEIAKDPGALGDSGFAEDQEQALRSQLEAIAKNAPNYDLMDIHPYPGVSLSIELDGVWGLTPGNAISSTQMPADYLSNKLYFMVRKVTHTIKDSDWTTSMDAILTVGQVTPIYLRGYDGSN